MTAFLEVLLVLWGLFGLYVAAVSAASNSSDAILLLLLGGSAALFSLPWPLCWSFCGRDGKCPRKSMKLCSF